MFKILYGIQNIVHIFVLLFETNNTMNKGTKKKDNYKQYNVDAINALVEKFGLSAYYIRQSINGNREGIVPDKIKKEYPQICKALEAGKEEIVKKFKNK